MARNESWIVNTAAYAALRSLGVFLNCFDVNENMAVVGAIGDRWFKRDARRRKRATDNIIRSLPDLSRDEAEDICRRSMRHLLQTFVVEVLFTPRLVTPTTWHRYVRFTDVQEALSILTKPQAAILISGHCGNFEMLGFSLATVGYPMTALARPLDLPRINDWLLDVRQKRGMTILTKFGALDEVPRLLQERRRVAFIADQNAGDKGLFVPFFNRLASAYKSIALLAMRFEVPIICGTARRRQPDRFEYEIRVKDVIHPPDWHQQDDPVYYITARYTRAIEEMVRDDPEQYFWVHRRWKSRPRHELNGRPFPTSLQRRLEALPWVTSEDMDRIRDHSARDSAHVAAANP